MLDTPWPHQLLQGTHRSWHFCQPQTPYPETSLQKPCPAVGHSFGPALAPDILQGTSVHEVLCLIMQGRSNHSPWAASVSVPMPAFPGPVLPGAGCARTHTPSPTDSTCSFQMNQVALTPQLRTRSRSSTQPTGVRNN